MGDYQRLNQEIKQAYAIYCSQKNRKPKNSRELAVIQSMESKRNQLAFDIIKNKEDHQEALDYFAITNLSYQPTTFEEQQKFSKTNLNQNRATKQPYNFNDRHSLSAGNSNDLGLCRLLLKFVEMELAQENNLTTLYTVKDNPLRQEMQEKIISQGKAIGSLASSLLRNSEIKTEIEKFKLPHAIKLADLGGYLAIRDRLQQGSHTHQDLAGVLQQVKQRVTSYGQSLSQKQHRARTPIDTGGGKCCCAPSHRLSATTYSRYLWHKTQKGEVERY